MLALVLERVLTEEKAHALIGCVIKDGEASFTLRVGRVLSKPNQAKVEMVSRWIRETELKGSGIDHLPMTPKVRFPRGFIRTVSAYVRAVGVG